MKKRQFISIALSISFIAYQAGFAQDEVPFGYNSAHVKEINYSVITAYANDDYSDLKVTEIHYHPLDHIIGIDTLEGSDFEFIEFKNTGQSTLNLSGFVLDSAVYCEFPINSIVGPGEFYVAAAKPSKFFDFYGLVPSANFQNSLANSGEEVLLLDATGQEVMRFTYDDHSPWPEDPDGNGPSLVARDLLPQGDPGDPSYWRSSIFVGGSPFADDMLPVSISESFEGLVKGFYYTYVYPNPTQDIVNIEFLDRHEYSNVSVVLYGINGAMLYSGGENIGKLDMQSLGIESGMYFLKIESKSGIDIHKIIYNSR